MYIFRNLKIYNKNHNINLKLDYKFLLYLKKNIKINKYLNILIKNNGCKGYIYFFYISFNLEKISILINYRNINILIYYFNLIFLFKKKIYIINNKYKIYIVIKNYININNICKCGFSFNL